MPFAELEAVARTFAQRVAADELTDAGKMIRIIEGDELVDLLPLVKGGGPGSGLQADAAAKVAALGLPTKSRGGRAPEHGLRFFAEQARLHVSALPDKPIRKVAKMSGYSHHAVRNHIARARSEELLTETPPGRAGGHLTPKAIELLEGKST